MIHLRLLMTFMKGNKLLYLGAIIATVISTMISFAGPLVLKISIDSIIGDKPIDLPQWFMSIIEFLGGKNILVQNIWLCSLSFIFITVLYSFFDYLKGKWSAMASESTAKNMRERLYDHLQHLPYDQQEKTETGDLIQRCTSDVETTRQFLSVQFVEVGRSIFMIITAIIIMFNLNFKMTLIAMASIPIIIVFAVIFFTIIKKQFLLSDEAEAEMSTVLQENLTGVRVVRAYAQQAFEMDKFDEKNRKFRDLTYKLIVSLAWYWAISDFICFSQVSAVIVFGSIMASKGLLTVGALVAFVTYEGMLIWPVRQMGRVLTDMGKAMVSLDRIKEILDKPYEKLEVNYERPVIKGDIEFKDVYFSYEPDSPVLQGVSFSVKAGETIAIMGPTGSGKSSLVHLLPGLYDYQGGSITIDGVELREYDKLWLRNNIGIVLQDPFLFSKTIKENIGLARKEAMEVEIVEAARAAVIHDTIENFDRGYETAVGEKGVTLSGGQKQRIAIARTLIQDCPILIFDDSLSAVDSETDLAIRVELSKRNVDTTTFIISHRISTLQSADRIIVLDNGRIEQQGTHEELIQESGLYRRIWEIQNNFIEEL